MKPFFSIGVPTYNRRDLLSQTLSSIVEQTFPDFEVIVGNDYTQESLSSDALGIDDPRVRFVNHPRNLGELANMNTLLGLSRGRYFTWQFDDDLYAPSLLATVHDALVSFNFPPCAFTSYGVIYGNGHPDFVANVSARKRLISGRRFLRLYWSGKLRAMGCTGIYDTDYLRSIGGVQALTDGPFALYSEYLLLNQAGLLASVAYVDAPLVQYRVHGDSWGCTKTEVDEFGQAGERLVHESLRILTRPGLRPDFRHNVRHILRHCLMNFTSKLIARQGRVDRHVLREASQYVRSLKVRLEPLRGSPLYWMGLTGLYCAVVRTLIRIAKWRFGALVLGIAPPAVRRLARRLLRLPGE
jgi:glycosyltransferase involved in cell wall biosynthesis